MSWSVLLGIVASCSCCGMIGFLIGCRYKHKTYQDRCDVLLERMMLYRGLAELKKKRIQKNEVDNHGTTG